MGAKGAEKKTAKLFAKADTANARKTAGTAALKLSDIEAAERRAAGESAPSTVARAAPARADPSVMAARLGGGVAPLKGSRLTTFADVASLSTRHGCIPEPLLTGCLKALELGARSKPSLVQAEAWGWLLSPTPPDLVAIAPTGSGKTLAFLLPILTELVATPSTALSSTPEPAPAAKSPETAMAEAATAAFKSAVQAGTTPDEAKAIARVEGQKAWVAAKRAAKQQQKAEAAGGAAAGGSMPSGAMDRSQMAAPLALVLAPTRELCLQTAETARLIATHVAGGASLASLATAAAVDTLADGVQAVDVSDGSSGGASMGAALTSACIVGGIDYVRQRDELLRTRPRLVVATPGRLLNLCGLLPSSSRARQQQKVGGDGDGGAAAEAAAEACCRLDGVRMLVLDEADRLLDMGFEADVGALMSLSTTNSTTAYATSAAASAAAAAAVSRPGRQEGKPWTMMFSATWNDRTAALARSVLADAAIHLTIGKSGPSAASTVDQRIEVLKDGRGAPRMRRLVSVLQQFLTGGSDGAGDEEEEDDDDDDDYELCGDEDKGEGADEGADGDDATEESSSAAATDANADANADENADDDDDEPEARIILFVVFKRQAKEVSKALSVRGLDCVALHGDLSQKARTAAVAAFTAGEARVLVATDVAARGLDIKRVSHVVNFSAGLSIEAYVHRVGRCGRAGRAGVAHTFVVRGVDEAIAPPMVQLLERSRATVPRELIEMANAQRLAEASATAKAARRAAAGDADAGAAAAADDDDVDEMREAQIANRQRQLEQQKAKSQKEKAQMSKKGRR